MGQEEWGRKEGLVADWERGNIEQAIFILSGVGMIWHVILIDFGMHNSKQLSTLQIMP